MEIISDAELQYMERKKMNKLICDLNWTHPNDLKYQDIINLGTNLSQDNYETLKNIIKSKTDYIFKKMNLYHKLLLDPILQNSYNDIKSEIQKLEIESVDFRKFGFEQNKLYMLKFRQQPQPHW